MADRFQLRVVTPTSEVVNETVSEVYAPGTVGEFGILPDHAAFLSSLEIGVIRFRSAGGERRLAIREGFAEVSDNVMTVLSEEAALKVDSEAAKTDLGSAHAKLKELSVFDEGYADADAERRWAEARLSLAK
jgi:F-type H+-transporting ATPase subunit epsilon